MLVPVPTSGWNIQSLPSDLSRTIGGNNIMTILVSVTPLHAAWRRCRPALAAAAVFSGVLNVLTLALPLHSMQVMDRVLASRSTDTLIFLTLAALGALLLAAALEAVRGRLLARAAEWF